MFFRPRNINLLLFGVLLLITGCKSPDAGNVERGSALFYREGYPDVRMVAVGLFDEDDLPGIELSVDITKGSLIYRNVDGVFQAEISMTVLVMQRVNREEVLIQNRTYDLKVSDTDQNVVTSPEIESVYKRIPVLPGSYIVTVTITDKASNRKTTRRSETTIPDPEGDDIGITSVLLLGKDVSKENEFIPLSTYFVSNRFDSLKFQYQITRPSNEVETVIDMYLYTFDTDTMPSILTSGLMPIPGSLVHRGIDYRNRIELTSTSRTLRFETGSILIEYITPNLPRGNYRFEVNIAGEDEVGLKAREFSVTGRNFPAVQNVRELAEPLAYLMRRRDYERILNISNPDSLKKEIDMFWLSEMRNRNRARQVIELYYNRVEQANFQFSNFKEGWKTDMGKIFILFGPPWYTENSLDTSIWYYSYNRQDPRTRFVFKRTRVPGDHFPFQHYILQREQFYHSIEYDIIQSWLSGNILNQL